MNTPLSHNHLIDFLNAIDLDNSIQNQLRNILREYIRTHKVELNKYLDNYELVTYIEIKDKGVNNEIS